MTRHVAPSVASQPAPTPRKPRPFITRREIAIVLVLLGAVIGLAVYGVRA